MECLAARSSSIFHDAQQHGLPPVQPATHKVTRYVT